MSLQSATMPFPARLKTSLQLDPVLLTIVLTLMLGGLVVLASASISISDRASGDPFFYVERQLIACVIGIAGAFICLLIPMKFWQDIGPLLLLAGFALLVVVLVPGVGYTVNGSTRWLRIGFLNLQVSEPARLCILLYVAGYLVRRNKSLRESFGGFLRPMLLLVLASVLLLAEPDFGAAIVLLATALAMLFVAGARLRDFFIFFGVAVIAMSALAISSPYRLNRLTGFLDPWSDPYNSGFQLTQSLIAIGRGEWLRVGLGDGVQKLFYLPEAHSDFIYAVLCEEWGFLGGAGVLALFAVYTWRGLRASFGATDDFGRFLALGITVMVATQALINVGVVLGMLPTTGIPLPFVSYGGSSLLVMVVATGILLNITQQVN